MARTAWTKRHRLIVRWGMPCAVLAGGLGYLSYLTTIRADPAAANDDGSIDGLTSVLERTASQEMARFRFEDVTIESGIDFRHFPGVRGSLLPEDMGPGVAWGDYDDDGDPDLFLVNFAAPLRAGTASDYDGACRLYRNDAGHFTDVSVETGLDLELRGLGAAWGDYDGDDDLDLYVTAYGANRLMRNDGGRFADVAAEAGVADPAFSAGCSWADYDRDGRLDLYVCNYVLFDERDVARTDTPSSQYGAEIPFTINPSSYPPAANRLYRNLGDGRFADTARDAGVANDAGRSLEAAWFDFDADGWIDLYVANDVSANGVHRNRGDGTFADIGASSLAADYRGAMGLAVGDVEHDGDLDLLVTHWVAQENALFENTWADGWTGAGGERAVIFVDSAERFGLGHVSLRTVGWATGFGDFDLDGHNDLWVVNGNTLEDRDDRTRLRPQPVHLFRRDPERGYYEVAAQACAALAEPLVGRGGATADFDGDGRLDLIVMRHSGAPLLLRNTIETTDHWLGVALRQRSGNTRAVGARVAVQAGGRQYVAQVDANASYLSQGDLVLHFGLGSATTVDELSVWWPDGTHETHAGLDVDRVIDVVRETD